MGKKMGINDKAAEAKARKQDAKSSAADAAKQKAEEDYWKQHENPKGKKDSKREEEERRRAEAAARKAENKRLAAEEEAALTAKKALPKKVTAHQLHLQSEAERRRMAQQAAERTDEFRREISEEEYAQQVEAPNVNRGEAAVDARSLDDALQQLSVTDSAAVDRHPEKRAKAAWEEYFERMLPQVKDEKPGLKLMQYKSRIFEMWQRSPDNPRNQARAAG